MSALSNSISGAVNYLLTIRISDFIDIIIVAYLIYKAIWFLRKTNSYNLAQGLLILLVVLWLSEVFRLTMINNLLRKAVELGLIALLILFQPELRRILERMGSSFHSGKAASSTAMDMAIAQTVLACSDMSASRTGALIIFERNVNLNNIMSTGTIINSDTTAELIKNIFYNKAPLHDGAMIVRNGRIAAAGCVLPLTQSTNLSKELGMRHRAGIGLSEQSDAVVIIVSEESGSISMAIDGMLKRHLSPPMLDKLLHSELIQDDDEQDKRSFRSIIDKLFGTEFNGDEKNNEKTL
ncbi:MAG: diadenylate cyclase CdaA [Oscillospiraceae bacterium]|nr:diadenylate cyclase CdaA [Oscillospiraceae bacterium]